MKLTNKCIFSHVMHCKKDTKGGNSAKQEKFRQGVGEDLSKSGMIKVTAKG